MSSGWQGEPCHSCGDPYKNLYEHLQSCDQEMVKVYIFGAEYECPDHYPWSEGPLGNSPCYQDHAYLIPRETYDRWHAVQDDWDHMNAEMRQITGRM